MSIRNLKDNQYLPRYPIYALFVKVIMLYSCLRHISLSHAVVMPGESSFNEFADAEPLAVRFNA